MVLKVYTDGGSRGNPGPSSIGGLGYLNGKRIFEFKKSIGIATNNDAEYRALIEALINIKYQISKIPPSSRLRRASKTTDQISKIEFFSDSRLLVNQVNGFFKVKNGKIKEYILKIRSLEQEINLPIVYHLVPREQNIEADRLVNAV